MTALTSSADPREEREKSARAASVATKKRTWCTEDHRSVSEAIFKSTGLKRTCSPPLHCEPTLPSARYPRFTKAKSSRRTPPVLHVWGSVDPELKSQSRRPQILPFQSSATSNETLVYWFACQPVANEGTVPPEVNMAWRGHQMVRLSRVRGRTGQMVKGHPAG